MPVSVLESGVEQPPGGAAGDGPASAPTRNNRAIVAIALAVAVVLAGGIFAVARVARSGAELAVRDARDGCQRFYALSMRTIRDQSLAELRVTAAHERLRVAALRGGDYPLVTELDELIAADSPTKVGERTGAVIGRCLTDKHLTYDQATALADELIRRAGIRE